MTQPSLIFGPVPPYNNPPIEPQNFQPSQFFISAISLGITTTVTTTMNMNYVLGQECRLLIPEGYGCTNLNQKTGFVLSIPSSNQVILSINSINSNSFVNAMLPTQAQIVAVGDVNNGQTNSSGSSNQGTAVLGSFINIS